MSSEGLSAKNTDSSVDYQGIFLNDTMPGRNDDIRNSIYRKEKHIKDNLKAQIIVSK